MSSILYDHFHHPTFSYLPVGQKKRKKEKWSRQRRSALSSICANKREGEKSKAI
jgi:hypothetical protein